MELNLTQNALASDAVESLCGGDGGEGSGEGVGLRHHVRSNGRVQRRPLGATGRRKER